MSSESSRNIAPVSEEALIISARQGDDNAFAALAKIYKRVLDFQIKNVNCPPSIKDDLFQEGLIGLFKAVKTYNGSTAFITYATACVRNSIISGIRKYASQSSKSVPTPVITTEETVPSAEEVLLDSVRARALYDKVFSVLSPYERLVFDMYLSEMSFQDIAFVTGKDAKSAHNAVYRIRTKLKQIVTQARDLPANQ